MSSTATLTNGKPARKQLADQLDRLDGIIDCLADRLPEAVADATREGARQAVRDVILELLTNPELRTLIAGLAPAAQPAVAPEPSSETAPAKSEFWGRVKGTCKTVKDATVRKCRAAKTAVVNTVRTLSTIMPLKKMLLVGGGVGVVVAAVSYVCPHSVSAAVSGVCGAATAVAVQVGRWFCRSAGLFGFGKA